jgi:hypothetical protein
LNLFTSFQTVGTPNDRKFLYRGPVGGVTGGTGGMTGGTGGMIGGIGGRTGGTTTGGRTGGTIGGVVTVSNIKSVN